MLAIRQSLNTEDKTRISNFSNSCCTMRKLYRRIQSYSLLAEESSLDIHTKLLIDLGIPEKLHNMSDDVLVVKKIQKKGEVRG